MSLNKNISPRDARIKLPLAVTAGLLFGPRLMEASAEGEYSMTREQFLDRGLDVLRGSGYASLRQEHPESALTELQVPNILYGIDGQPVHHLFNAMRNLCEVDVLIEGESFFNTAKKSRVFPLRLTQTEFNTQLDYLQHWLSLESQTKEITMSVRKSNIVWIPSNYFANVPDYATAVGMSESFTWRYLPSNHNPFSINITAGMRLYHFRQETLTTARVVAETSHAVTPHVAETDSNGITVNPGGGSGGASNVDPLLDSNLVRSLHTHFRDHPQEWIENMYTSGRRHWVLNNTDLTPTDLAVINLMSSV